MSFLGSCRSPVHSCRIEEHGSLLVRACRLHDAAGPLPNREWSLAIRIGLIIPLQGAAGLWGPSCDTCARLAAAELEAGSGLMGEPVEFAIIDAGASRREVAHALASAIAPQPGTGLRPVEALIGMHLSDLRAFVTARIPLDMPYIYTPLYEGGERSPNVFAIGETPERLLGPGIAWLAKHRHARRWFLVGNDYIWPRRVHRVARGIVARSGGMVVGAELLPIGLQDFEPALAAIKSAAPDAVLVSLIGDDAVRFNRTFAGAGLAGRIQRLATAVDENVIYGIGADCTENMVLSAGYFAHLETSENALFRESYHGLLGDAPPMQNDLGQSCYEGVHYLAALAHRAGCTSAKAMRKVSPSPLDHRSARFSGQGAGRSRKIHLAMTDGHDLHVVASR